jgi:hypothetical protein
MLIRVNVRQMGKELAVLFIGACNSAGKYWLQSQRELVMVRLHDGSCG